MGNISSYSMWGLFRVQVTDTLIRIECSKKGNLWVNVLVICWPSNAEKQPTVKHQWHTKKYLFSLWIYGVQWLSAGLAHVSVVSCSLARHRCWSWPDLRLIGYWIWHLDYFVSYLSAGCTGHVLMAMAEENEQESKYKCYLYLYLPHIWHLFIGQSKSYDGTQSQIVRALLRRQIQEWVKN